MKSVSTAPGRIVIAVALGCITWIAGCGSSPAGAKQESGETENVPTGPQPRAVTDETTLDFGAMQVDEERTHEFTIRNDGEAPLELKNAGSSCSACTRNDFEDVTIEPGEEAKVLVVWFPEENSEEFRKRFFVGTNDPERPKVEFTVEGRVDSKLHVEPRTWDQGVVERDAEVKVEGKIYSRVVDELPAPTFEVADEDMVVSEPEPLDDEALALLDAKVGYKYTVTFRGSKPGGFTRDFTMHVDSDGGAKFRMQITGRVSGPLTIQAFDGARYSKTLDMVDLGTFSAATGKRATLSLLFKSVEEPLVLEAADADPFEVSIRKDETYALPKRERHLVDLTFPEGGPTGAALNEGEFPKIVVKTSHPDVEQIEILVRYVAE